LPIAAHHCSQPRADLQLVVLDGLLLVDQVLPHYSNFPLTIVLVGLDENKQNPFPLPFSAFAAFATGDVSHDF
jgi:hypothetical protein